ncbi:hypothetical protein FQR65_LT20118 [Abscondita terminalis]|nr:hypothetical protein FQR65_LT20118 [Abscondita terminalis]
MSSERGRGVRTDPVDRAWVPSQVLGDRPADLQPYTQAVLALPPVRLVLVWDWRLTYNLCEAMQGRSDHSSEVAPVVGSVSTCRCPADPSRGTGVLRGKIVANHNGLPAGPSGTLEQPLPRPGA